MGGAGRGVIALLDIDGTLLHGRPVAHQRALAAAVEDVFGVPADREAVMRADPAGRTDREIAVRMLAAAGVEAAVAEAGLDAWCARAVERYLGAADAEPAPVAAPDAARALTLLRAAGVATALVTGNLEDIAHDKIARAGLGGHFPRGQGGFGSDALERAELVRVALRRAGATCADGVVVGDTPRDVAAARGAGCRVVAVTTGHFDAAALAGADHVAATLLEAATHIADGRTA
jgi:phosphoglycolate phosphatase-like HAD superfamily hydrolase